MKKIVVIGAGYTGITAALELAKNGYEVEILEASDSIGGLASGFKIEGAPIERAYHHIFKTDTDIINLAKELEIEEKLQWHDSSVALYYKDRLYSFNGALDLLQFKPLSILNRFRAGLVVLYLQKTKKWERLQRISAYSWMKKWSGAQACKVIWEPLLRGKFDTHFEHVSMAWLWSRIHIRAQSREKGGEKLGYFDGGFEILTEALVKSLREHGVKIKLGQKIAHINSDGNKAEITLSEGGRNIYDACIVTTPSQIFAKLIANSPDASSKYAERLNSIQYLGARLMVFSSSQEISKYYWHNINDNELPFLVFINHTRLINKKNYNNKYIYYIAAYVDHSNKIFTCGDSGLEELWLESLQKIFPNFNKNKISEKYFFKFNNAQHIVDTDYAKKIPAHRTPLNKVYLANFSQIYPEDRGTNFAVRDGRNIARTVIQDVA